MKIVTIVFINLKGRTVLINCEIIACIAFMFQIRLVCVAVSQLPFIFRPAFLTAMTYLIILFLLKLFYE